jgi:hypothetical protein
MELTVKLPNVPAEALPTIAAQIRNFGAVVNFETPFAGTVESIAGKARFLHGGDNELSVSVELDTTHFSAKLFIGGLRQTVEEGVELFRKTRAAKGSR